MPDVDNSLNGIRTYRPGFEALAFPSEKIRQEISSWVAGVRSGGATRALLLTGPFGLGKTTLGLALSRHLGAADREITEINCGSQNVEQVRELIGKFQYLPVSGAYRVFILDESHRLTDASQEALLKPTEETLPPKTILIFCTSDPAGLKPALRSRLYEIRLTPYPDEMIAEILLGLPNPPKPQTAARIAQFARGNPRAALAMLEKTDGVPDAPVDDFKVMSDIQITEAFFQNLYGILVEAKEEGFASCHPGLYFAAQLVREDFQKLFFEKILEWLEVLWLYGNDRTPTLSAEDKKFLEPFGLGQVRKGVRPGTGRLATIHSELLYISIQSQPLGHLRSWAMRS